MAVVSNEAAQKVAEGLSKAWKDPKISERLRTEFASAQPFPHVMLRPFLGDAEFRAVREELQKVDATQKETDLFRFFQTQDFAPGGAERSPKRRRAESGAEASSTSGVAGPTALQTLCDFFGSADFRELCSGISQCGELSERVDLAAQIYPPGGHLLCHDDVIGTRKVSFIYYLTDPEEEWKAADGGCLELYAADRDGYPGTPANRPAKEVLPLSNALVFFVVEPGKSFHAVREVRGERARISIQGWLHAPSLEATKSPDMRNIATLQQILGPDAPSAAGALSDSAPAEGKEKAVDEDADGTRLSAEDIAHLSSWMAPEYLKDEQMREIAGHFAEQSYVMLTEILRKDVASEIIGALLEADREDGFGPDCKEPEVPQYEAGAVDGWSVVGPPHLRRFLQYPLQTAEAPAGGCHSKLGARMQHLAKELVGSGAFRRWLYACTQLEQRSAEPSLVRRFRPGMDYTVAVHASLATLERAELDATLMFTTDAAEAKDVWASEEVGGFECYLEADDEKTESVEAQEVYRGAMDEEGPLLNVPATCNALSIVLRDRRTLRFMKYLSRDAPSSRVDVSARFTVDAPEEESSDDGEPEEIAARSGAAEE
eukprot:CAMPEP_0170244896 /NCGR_PEP_ID=MMETSP0116_2-20130129/22229_1 /TAXON_ID=400756 /ORGANISM="Durinskia baltica, Strain CSIRO CS-38" /LENGTH=600 /DNA_ID=CAMNT_0010495761 /DNA_START=87 /DNA_END=1889 /DNA_ORIENTATION=-